jgi:protein-disulfide isomerase
VTRSRGLFALAIAALAIGIALFSVGHRWQEARAARALAENAEQIFRSPESFVAGNPNGDVSVVAFYDHNCPYCREGAPALAKLVADDPQIRLVLKELPVLGSDSESVARVALAAMHQGKYFELYERLFAEPGRATKEKAMRIASALGLDTARLERDMQNVAIDKALADTKQLANALGVRGVPFYLVGDRVVGEGGDDLYGELTARVAGVRRNGCHAAC